MYCSQVPPDHLQRIRIMVEEEKNSGDEKSDGKTDDSALFEEHGDSDQDSLKTV